MENSWIFVLLFGCFLTGSDGLRDVRLDTTGYVRRGETITMSCRYDLENDTLYAVKWYKGNQEFYRYVPKEVPPTQKFDLPGIHVDLKYSNVHEVLLESVPMEISGKYKCLVSVEHSFKTLEDIQDLVVVAVGYGSPILSVDKHGEDQMCEFHGGENITARCSISQTSPPANITWYIDDREVRWSDAEIRKGSVPDENDTSLSTTWSTINYRLPDFFRIIKLKCTGSLYNVYESSSIFEFHRRQVQPKPSTNTLLHPNSTSRGIAQISTSGLVFYIFLTVLMTIVNADSQEN